MASLVSLFQAAWMKVDAAQFLKNHMYVVDSGCLRRVLLGGVVNTTINDGAYRVT